MTGNLVKTIIFPTHLELSGKPQKNSHWIKATKQGKLLKPGTGNEERRTKNVERGTEKGERRTVKGCAAVIHKI